MTTTAVAVVDPNVASAAQIREWSIAVREQIPDMTEDELDQVEALLIALRKRLRQLGKDIDETERSRILAWERKGQLLGEGKPGDYDREALLENANNALSAAERQERHRARLLAAYPEVVKEAIEAKKPTLNKAVNMCKRRRAEDEAAKVAEQMAMALMSREKEQ